jgi:hypothetical protein
VPPRSAALKSMDFIRARQGCRDRCRVVTSITVGAVEVGLPSGERVSMRSANRNEHKILIRGSSGSIDMKTPSPMTARGVIKYPPRRD